MLTERDDEELVEVDFDAELEAMRKRVEPQLATGPERWKAHRADRARRRVRDSLPALPADPVIDLRRVMPYYDNLLNRAGVATTAMIPPSGEAIGEALHWVSAWRWPEWLALVAPTSSGKTVASMRIAIDAIASEKISGDYSAAASRNPPVHYLLVSRFGSFADDTAYKRALASCAVLILDELHEAPRLTRPAQAALKGVIYERHNRRSGCSTIACATCDLTELRETVGVEVVRRFRAKEVGVRNWERRR